jgi:DNA-binding HxlR family transcriptional regulator
MKNLIELIKEGVNTTSKLQTETEIPLSTLKRMLDEMISQGTIVREGTGPSSFYRILKPTPTAMDILDKMRLIHQQKSMGFPYRKLSREAKLDSVVNLYIDTFPGMVDDYNDEEHHSNIVKAWAQLEKEI